MSTTAIRQATQKCSCRSEWTSTLHASEAPVAVVRLGSQLAYQLSVWERGVLRRGVLSANLRGLFSAARPRHPCGSAFQVDAKEGGGLCGPT